jgi:Cu/Ag efflux pump CusA
VMPGFGEELYPTFKERDVFADWATPPGSSGSEENRIVVKGSKDFRAVPAVQSFGAHIGQAFLAEEVVGPNFGESWFSIDKNADYDKTIGQLEEVVDSYPGVFRELLTYLRERIDEVLAATTEPIVVRIFGDDLRELRHQANRVKDALEDVPGLDELNTELQNDVPEVQVTERPAGRRYGLKPGDVRRAVSTLVSSEEVGDIFRGGRAYDVHVWSTPKSRRNLTDIRNLPIDTPSGGRVRLSDVAYVRVRPTINIIRHENSSRRIDVSAAVAKDSNLSEAVADVRDRLKGIDFPTGMHAELKGEAVESEHAQDRLLLFGGIAAIGIFLLLQAAFGSLRIATMFFLTLPMALVGGVLAVYLISDSILSLGSFVGFLTVFGIAARNGILMINHCQHLEEREGIPFGAGLVMRGAEERLSPIMMTALATALAIVPLIVGGSIPGHEIEHPMAIVIMGGLITSTLVNLFIVPALYLRFGKSKRELRELRQAT